MEDITTIDLQKYIKKKLFSPKTERQEIWLHNLPNDETLFDIISQLREKYKNETFVIKQNINITNKKINKEINFSNCIFLESISFNGTTFKLNVDFSNCTFRFKTSFANTSFEGYTNFEGSIFYNVNFRSAIFNKGSNNFINFSFSSFYKANFNSSNFKSIVSFEFSTFKYSSLEYISFHSTVFEDEVSFSYTKLSLGRENNQKTSSPPLVFIKAEFKNNTYFDNVDYSGDVIFSDCIFGLNNKEKSISSIDFSEAKFNQNVKFSLSTFNSKVILRNTNFKDLLYFHKVDFYQPTQFLFTDFRKKVFFANTHFFEEVQFLYCNVESNSFIRFESSIFEKCLEISRSNFDYCKLRFWDIQIKGEDKINEYIKYKKDFGETLIEPSVYGKIRESFRFIKSTFYAENNKIEGLKFYEKEMSVYLEEKREETNEKSLSKNKKTFIEEFREKPILNIGLLLVSISTFLWAILKCHIFYIASVFFTSLIILGIVIKNKESLKYRNPIKQNYYMPIILLVIATVLIYIYIYNIENPWYIIGAYIVLLCGMLLLYFSIEKDKIILWFNKNSNEFDTNWVVGVNFSLLVGTLTYLIVLLSMFIFTDLTIDNINSSIFLTSLVDVFNITKWSDIKIIDLEISGFSYLLLFIGRIFIGYGYYQTIQAFRKFGKS